MIGDWNEKYKIKQFQLVCAGIIILQVFLFFFPSEMLPQEQLPPGKLLGPISLDFGDRGHGSK